MLNFKKALDSGLVIQDGWVTTVWSLEKPDHVLRLLFFILCHLLCPFPNKACYLSMAREDLRTLKGTSGFRLGNQRPRIFL